MKCSICTKQDHITKHLQVAVNVYRPIAIMNINSRFSLTNRSISALSPDSRFLLSSTTCPLRLNKRSLSTLVHGAER